MAEHILTIAEDRNGDRSYSITCPPGNGCAGWIECREPHEVAGVSADIGPHDCEESAPWAGCDDYPFHGMPHTWRWGHGWTVPYDRCIVQYGDWEPPGNAEVFPPGDWPVDDDWEDTAVYLMFVDPTPKAGGSDA